jgi:ABC-type antimicrobial peptide transport system permease subunit
VRALDPDLAVFNVKTMDERLAEVVAQPRVNLIVLAAFAAMALVIAAIGTYGVMSYAVAQRTRELGIRVALGASGDRVVRLVVRQGMMPALAGVGLGLIGALLGARLLASLLYGVGTYDAATFAIAVLSLGTVAVAACYLPARRAAKADPMLALRGE